jgi:hypothetical protein
MLTGLICIILKSNRLFKALVRVLPGKSQAIAEAAQQRSRAFDVNERARRMLAFMQERAEQARMTV